MQQGVIVRIFVASPSDVPEEREEACRVVAEWNAANSLSRSIIIEPVRVETHIQAAQGAHPQDIINGQLLERCDLLLAILWARIGTSTGKHASGTIQEIREFQEAKGPERVIVFFSERDLPNDVDMEQVALVRAFRSELQSTGLYKTYKFVTEFQRLFRQQLDLAMNAILQSEEIEQLPQRVGQEVTLHPESNTILVAASHGDRGRVYVSRDRAGHQVHAGNLCYSRGNDPRSEARWEAAITQLVEFGFLEDAGHKSEVFRLTKDGFEAADKLWYVILLRRIHLAGGESNYVQSKTLNEKTVVGQMISDRFVQEKLSELAQMGLIEHVPIDGGIAAAKLTLEGSKGLRENKSIEFAESDAPESS